MRPHESLHPAALRIALAGLLVATNAQAQSGVLSSKTEGAEVGSTIEKLLVDYGNASASAAALAGVGGSPPTVVENLRDVAVVLKGDTPLSRKVFALTITPTRTDWAFPRVSLHDYKTNLASRVLASTTLAYAQGESTHEKVDFRRRAWSIETSAFIDPRDDPVVAVADSGCAAAANKVLIASTEETSTSTAEAPPKPTAAGPAPLNNVTPSKGKDLKAALKAYDDCADAALSKANQRWNKSRWSVSLATGWIQRADDTGSSVRLGSTLAGGVVYGFDHVEALRENAAWTFLLRRTNAEPVLKSLVAGPVQRQSSTLWATRLAGGSSTFRGVIEFSDKRRNVATGSDMAFTRALGIDVRVVDGLWLNVRSGKQRRADGIGEAVGSFVNVSYSPSATLKR